MRVASSMLGVQPSACRLAAPLRARQCSTRRALAVVRAQQGHTGEAAAAPPPPPPAAAPAEQQLVVAPAVPHTAAQEAEEYVQVAAAESDASYGASAAAEQQAVAARQAVPPPAQPAPGGAPLGLILQHPAARIGGMAAAAFLGTTLLITLFRMSRDPQHKRSKVINKNKMVVDTIGKYLPGNREAMSAGSFRLLKLQTGFTSVEVFRKYLWFLLRERQFDEGALDDLVALKAALGLSDEEVAAALRERAERVYEKYGTVMVNLEGMSQAGIERKASARNLFMKLLSLTESRALLSAEAASGVDLGKVFGVTQRDVLTLRSGYSAEGEGAQLEGQGEGGEEE